MNNWFACAPLGRKNPQASDLLPRPPLLARDASFLFLRRSEELSAEEQETLLMLRSLHAEVHQAYELVQQFAQMLRTRTGEYLDAWLEQARASQIREVQSFVLLIERDKAAVFAGLTLPHSNGIVEGKVNKLKLIKRMGYGRAGFPLLRKPGAPRFVKNSRRLQAAPAEHRRVFRENILPSVFTCAARYSSINEEQAG